MKLEELLEILRVVSDVPIYPETDIKREETINLVLKLIKEHIS